MSTEKATAIVLRVVDFSETSAVVTLFTQEFGKVRALAKGARRPKGPFESALDLLALCRIVFLRKTSDTLNLLTEAKLVRRFRPAGRSLASLYAAYYVAELLARLTDDGDPLPELFTMADETLAGLSDGQPVAPLVLRFELMALHLVGHLPSLDRCVECGKPVEAKGRVAFALLGGGVVCGSCRAGKRQILSISAEVIATLQLFANHESNAWRDAPLDRSAHGELRSVLNNYLTHLLGSKPRMHEFLGAICT